MELDDFKNMGKDVKPAWIGDEKITQGELDTLIEALKANDIKDRKRIISFIIIIGMFIAIYSGSFAIQKETMRPGYALLILGFVLILFYFFRMFIRNKNVDYSAPTITFLRKAEQRCRFMNPIDWMISVPLMALLITGGGMIVDVSFARYFPGSILPLVIYLIFMAGVVGIGFWASHRNWQRDKGHLLGEIRKMKKDFKEI